MRWESSRKSLIVGGTPEPPNPAPRIGLFARPSRLRLNPFGSRGGSSSPDGLHFGHGIPAPPHWQACGPSTALVQKTGDCGKDYESLAGKNRIAGSQWTRAGDLPSVRHSSETRPAPQPRGSGFFVDPGQTGTPAQSHAGEMEPTSWTRMLSAIFTMAVAACAIYIILFEM
jgi:hypothetical protein